MNYTRPLEKVNSHFPEHIEHLKKQYESGHFLVSGRNTSCTGGIIFSGVDSKELQDEILNQNPFYQNNVAEHDITQFAPSMAVDEPTYLKDK